MHSNGFGKLHLLYLSQLLAYNNCSTKLLSSILRCGNIVEKPPGCAVATQWTTDMRHFAHCNDSFAMPSQSHRPGSRRHRRRPSSPRWLSQIRDIYHKDFLDVELIHSHPKRLVQSSGLSPGSVAIILDNSLSQNNTCKSSSTFRVSHAPLPNR